MSARKRSEQASKGNPSESGTKNLADELAELGGLNATVLRQRWRVLYRTEAPSYRDGIAEFAAGLAKATDAKRSSGSRTSCERRLLPAYGGTGHLRLHAGYGGAPD
jgi:hypothetical protein